MGTRHTRSTSFIRSIPPRVGVRVGVLLFLGAGAVLLAELPAFIEFGVAVMAAIGWAVFLERYWSGAQPDPTPDGGRRMSAPTNEPFQLVSIGMPTSASCESTKAA